MKLTSMDVLSDGEIRAIHDASLDILANCGVKVLSPHLFSLMKDKGLETDPDKQIIRFSQTVIENALATIPPRIEVYDRQGAPAFVLGDGTPRVAAGHNAVFWVDSQTGQTRLSRVADVEHFAGLCQQLDVIDMIASPVMPQDGAVPRASLLYAIKACITFSRKPIFFSTDNKAVNRGCIELLRCAFAGNFDQQVYGISQLSPTSPLFWEETVCDAILDTLDTNVPLAILPEPNAGVSCPYTLAGLLTMNNAECLSGLAMIQILKPHHPVMYANSWTATDMRSGAALVGSVETSLCHAAGAQLARFYHVPSHTTAPNSDNHAHDEQNAWEKTFSLLSSVASGTDLIVNCGMFATGMTASDEQLLMDAEIAAMCNRFTAGIDVSADTIAADLIKRVGPQGESYLTQDHTLEHLHSDEFLLPDLAVRGPLSAWQAAGSKDTYQRAQDHVKQLAAQNSASLDSDRLTALNACLSQFEETLAQ